MVCAFLAGTHVRICSSINVHICVCRFLFKWSCVHIETVSAAFNLRRCLAEIYNEFLPLAPCQAALKRLYWQFFFSPPSVWEQSTVWVCVSMFRQANQSKFKFGILCCPSECCSAKLFVYSCDHHMIWQRSGPLWECRGMFVFVCSAYIKVPICVLAGGSKGKRIGEVRSVAVRLGSLPNVPELVFFGPMWKCSRLDFNLNRNKLLW